MRTAFVLSGGGSLGAVQVGMVRALYERGIRPDFWVGTSVGALNAAYLAARPPAPSSAIELARLWRSVRRADVFPLRPLTGFFGFFGASNFLVPAGPLRRLLERHLHLDRLEHALADVHVVATDLHSGRELLLSRGPAVRAVMASVSLPGVLPPVPWEGRLLIDGGVSNNTPISHAVQLGADNIYVLPAGASGELQAPPTSALGMLLHALNLMLMRHLLAEIERLRPRARLFVVPPPCPQGVAPIDFDQSDLLVSEGWRAATSHLDEVAAGLAPPAPRFGITRAVSGQISGVRTS
jgi:NTE family protein